MNGKNLFWIIPAVITLVLGSILFAVRPEKGVYVAALIAQSGAGQGNSAELVAGIEFAIQEINKEGGIGGRQVELILEDTETDADLAQEQFLEIEKKYKPLFYVSSLSTMSNALGELADEHEAPLMALVATAPEVTEGHDWVYRFWPIASDELPAIRHIVEETEAKHLDVLYFEDAFGTSIAQAAHEEFQDELEMHLFPFRSTEEIDWEKAVESDLIYIVGFQGNLIQIQSTLNELGYEGDRMTVSGGASQETRDDPNFEGTYVAAPIVYFENYLLASELRNKFDAANEIKFGHYAATGYEGMMLLSQMFIEGDLTRDNLKNRLDAGFTYPGVFGDQNLEPGEKDISFELYPAQLRDGEIHYLDF